MTIVDIVNLFLWGIQLLNLIVHEEVVVILAERRKTSMNIIYDASEIEYIAKTEISAPLPRLKIVATLPPM
jgi:hypothetical protein